MNATTTLVLLTLGGVLLSGGPAAAADADANRRASANYDAVMQDRPEFRANREHLECDSIESLDLRAQCVASFSGSPPRPKVEPPAKLDPANPLVTITNGPVRNADD